MIDHAIPFHVSMRAAPGVNSVYPTAIQKDVLVQDTPVRALD